MFRTDRKVDGPELMIGVGLLIRQFRTMVGWAALGDWVGLEEEKKGERESGQTCARLQGILGWRRRRAFYE